MEKANVAVNKLIQQQRLHELACVVVDEAHMVADPQRCGAAGVVGEGGRGGRQQAQVDVGDVDVAVGVPGAAPGVLVHTCGTRAAWVRAPCRRIGARRGMMLELLLTKLVFACQCLPEVARRLQVIAMSATMSGLEHMRAWLRAVRPPHARTTSPSPGPGGVSSAATHGRPTPRAAVWT